MRPLPDNFRYLNREKRWLDFHHTGLALTSSGALQLLSGPKLIDTPPDFTDAVVPTAPSGVAVDASGRIFYSVPEQNAVFAVGGCSADATQLDCFTEASGLAGLNAPRGLLVLDQPRRLVIADSGNHRVLFLDLDTFEIRDVWGQDDLAANPQPGSAAGKFNHPWSVSSDGDGNLYVLDFGNHRVQKFSPRSEVDEAFALRVQQVAPSPGALAVWGKGTSVNVFVYDTVAQAIFIFDATGAPRDSSGGKITYDGMTQVLALAASADALYAGDNHLRSVLSFSRSANFEFSGAAAGFQGPIAALAIDPAGGLVIYSGGGAQPLHATADGSYLPLGVLWSDAIAGRPLPVAWNRLRAVVQDAPGAHIEFYYAISNSTVTPPVNPAAADPFSDPAWIELPNDVEDFLLAGNKALYLYLGAIFRGDRTATASLSQMRADFDNEGYLPYLPAIYREPAPTGDYLRRFVALFAGVFDDIEGEIDSLARYFNPQAAPAETLPWLASWLAVDLDQGEPVSRIRTNIASAYQRYRWRGTAEGLKLALLHDAGVHANIVQPIANANFLLFSADTACSGSPSTAPGLQLGGNTTLPSMQPGGAVVGMTAELDHSYLITDGEFGEPLFDGTAYQFIVEVYASEVATKERLSLVNEIVECEKPAHTMWRLSIIDATMHAGSQARVGIDAIVSGTPGPTGLGDPSGAGGLRLGGSPSPRVGASRLGQNLKLEQ